MNFVMTDFRITSAANVREKTQAEVRNIIADLNARRLAGNSIFMPFGKELFFVTLWPRAYKVGDSAMDSQMEQKIRMRLGSIDPSVSVIKRERYVVKGIDGKYRDAA